MQGQRQLIEGLMVVRKRAHREVQDKTPPHKKLCYALCCCSGITAAAGVNLGENVVPTRVARPDLHCCTAATTSSDLFRSNAVTLCRLTSLARSECAVHAHVRTFYKYGRGSLHVNEGRTHPNRRGLHLKIPDALPESVASFLSVSQHAAVVSTAAAASSTHSNSSIARHGVTYTSTPLTATLFQFTIPFAAR